MGTVGMESAGYERGASKGTRSVGADLSNPRNECSGMDGQCFLLPLRRLRGSVAWDNLAAWGELGYVG